MATNAFFSLFRIGIQTLFGRRFFTVSKHALVRPHLNNCLASQEGMQICRYCHLEIKNESFEAHEEYCGSRTEQCPECSDFVMLKDWEKHQSMRLYHGKYFGLFRLSIDKMCILLGLVPQLH